MSGGCAWLCGVNRAVGWEADLIAPEETDELAETFVVTYLVMLPFSGCSSLVKPGRAVAGLDAPAFNPCFIKNSRKRLSRWWRR